MALNTFVQVTLNTGTGASPVASPVYASAAGGNVTVSWDSAVVTTQAQLRACVAAAVAQSQGQLTGP